MQQEQKTSMTVGLCSDDLCIHRTVHRLLQAYSGTSRTDFKLVYFDSGKKLLSYSGDLDFLLLDIDMGKMEGIEAARHLNARGVKYKIIALAGAIERYKEAFQIGAFRFIMKPVSESELFEALDEGQAYMAGMGEIRVYWEGLPISIKQRDVNYIMSDRDAAVVFTNDSEYCSGDSLAKWVKELDERIFFKCHRSYIVNLGKIARIEKEMAILLSGEKIPISRRNKKAFLQAFREYDTWVR